MGTIWAQAYRFDMGTTGANSFAIMQSMGHTDIKTTMIYVSLGKSHIREHVEKLNGIYLHPTAAPRMNALPAPACINKERKVAPKLSTF